VSAPRPTPGALFLAGPEGASAGILVLHAWWGRTADPLAFAEDLARAGHAVAVPDLFAGRTAATVAEAEALVESADPVAAESAALAGADALRARLAPGARIATIGFSYGVPLAMAVAQERPEVAATVLYYGTGDPAGAERSSAPVLLHLAADDPFEDPGWVATYLAALRAAGRSVTEIVWPGTGHWFAEPSRSAWDPAAAGAAFQRTLAFLAEHLPSPGSHGGPG